METDLYHVSKQRHRMLFDAIKFDGFSRIDGIAEPDFHHLANAVNDMPHIMVEDCLSYLDWCRRENRNGYIDVLHDIMSFYWDKPAYQPRLTNWRNRERNTIEKHVWNIVAEARDSGELNALDTILDYLLPGCDHQETPQGEKTVLSCYEFDDCFCIPQGSEEGIYLHWVLRGRFRQEQKRNTDVHVDIASIKTLQTDLAAYKIMGEAAGVLEYFSRQYVGNNLKLYTPDEELKKMIDPADFPAAGRPGNQKIISRQP